MMAALTKRQNHSFPTLARWSLKKKIIICQHFH
jgi:hypothetical protein